MMRDKRARGKTGLSLLKLYSDGIWAVSQTEGHQMSLLLRSAITIRCRATS